MKFKDPITGEYKTLHLKTGDTLPVGTIVSFEGDEIPEGYEEVVGEEARVVISSTEPTTGEEVWIQKGKNLFNKNSVVVGYLNEDGSIDIENAYRTSAFITVIPNTTYYKTKTDSVRSKFYDKNKKPLTNNYNDLGGSGNFAFTTPENAYYLRVSLTIENLDTLQIEQGDTATSYEPFTRKIYTKNDNGVYEEFYNETNREVYSTSEQRIGTWIDGKPLYRKTIKYTTPNTSEYVVVADVGQCNVKHFYGQCDFGQGNIYPIPYGEGAYFNVVKYLNEWIFASTNGFEDKKCELTIEYTKTTD
jgi:hypothetical protein